MKNNKKIFVLIVILTTGFFGIFFKFNTSAQTINTGNASSQTVIENVVNTNVIKCKECITPSPTPTRPAETPTPTPTPTPGQGDGGGGGEQPSGGGVGGPSAPSAPSQGEVLGLSTTSGEENIFFQIFKLVPSLILGAASLSLLKKNG
ncbi:MAG: hypothetical protein Q8P80_02470 [Candidatus Levybacteria bacterium]|nr:hypothetical protein [Candidatus Levybacteria bacterium]